MKIKTSELTGAALDRAVLQSLDEGSSDLKGGTEHYADELWGEFSTWWSQGGPIIEREKIDLVWQSSGDDVWTAYLGEHDEHRQTGPTPLIAAMRCFVASKLGDEVDVPDELVKE
jgi:hypothetical protein